MKKTFMVTHQVNDAKWWLDNNSLAKTWGHLGVKFKVFWKKDTNLVGYVAEIPAGDWIDFMLKSTTLASNSMKADGVLKETIQWLELIEN